MEEYTEAIQPAQIDPKKKKCQKLYYFENKEHRRLTGLLAWLAENTRPDIQFAVLQMSRANCEATIANLKYANNIVKKAKAKTSKIVFTKIADPNDLMVIGIGDASYTAGEKAVGGQILMLANKNNGKAVPIVWKSKLIKKVCKSPKDSETLNTGAMVDNCVHLAKQLKQILYGKNGEETFKIPIRIFTDSLGLIESIASSKPVERRPLRAKVSDLKYQLEENVVESHCWLQDEEMITDILTKDKKDKFGLDDLMKENYLDAITKLQNRVRYVEGDYKIDGRKLRDKLAPMKPPPRKKPLKKEKVVETTTNQGKVVETPTTAIKDQEKKKDYKKAG